MFIVYTIPEKITTVFYSIVWFFVQPAGGKLSPTAEAQGCTLPSDTPPAALAVQSGEKRLYVEPEQDNVAILHHILLALGADKALLPGGGH